MSFSIGADSSSRPLVLALDVGSTGTRGGLFDATGRPVSQHRHKVHHEFTSGADGTSVIDADQVVEEVVTVIDAVLSTHRRAAKSAAPIAGVGIDTFSSSLIGVGSDDRAVTPCYTYADSRCAPEVAELRAELDEVATQQRTGTRLHASYLPARLRWLARSEPETVARVTRWLSLSEYVHLRLLGDTAAGTSVAAWTGMLDRRTADWDAAMMEVSRSVPELFSPVRHPDHALAVPKQPRKGIALSAKVWSLLADAHWAPGLSDGFASNVGAGGTDASSAVIAAATSGAMRVLVDQVPDHVGSGLWCYPVDRSRSIVGGALNDVGRAVSWLEATVRLPAPEELTAAMLTDPVPTTPLVLPFFTGERSTGWAGQARAVITGLSSAHTGIDLARGVFEGIAASYARVAAQLAEVAGTPRQILASGRVGADLPGLLPVLADALQAPVTPVTIKRSTLRGTALVVLDVVAPDHERAAPTTGPTHEPHPDRAAHHRERLTEFEKVYAAIHG